MNRADLEFYYGGLVLKTAMNIANCDETTWNNFSTRTRIKHLNTAGRVLCSLINGNEMAKFIKQVKIFVQHTGTVTNIVLATNKKQAAKIIADYLDPKFNKSLPIDEHEIRPNFGFVTYKPILIPFPVPFDD